MEVSELFKGQVSSETYYVKLCEVKYFFSPSIICGSEIHFK